MILALVTSNAIKPDDSKYDPLTQIKISSGADKYQDNSY